VNFSVAIISHGDERVFKMKTKKLNFKQFTKSYEKDVMKVFMDCFKGLKKEDFVFDWNKRTFEVTSNDGAGPERMQMVIAVNEQMGRVIVPS